MVKTMGTRPVRPLRLAFRGLAFDLADALVTDAQQKACITRRVAGGAALRDRVAHCAGSGILRGAGALPFTKGRLNCLADPAKRVEIRLDCDVERVLRHVEHERDCLARHELDLIETSGLGKDPTQFRHVDRPPSAASNGPDHVVRLHDRHQPFPNASSRLMRIPIAVISLTWRCLGTVTSTDPQRQTSCFAPCRSSLHVTPRLRAVLATRRRSLSRFLPSSLS